MNTFKSKNIDSEIINKNNAERFRKAVFSLELDKILNMLAQYANIEQSKTAVLNIFPSVSRENIKNGLKRVTEIKNITVTKGRVSYGHVKDVKDSVRRADLGAMLSARELLEIASLLHAVKSTLTYFSSVKDIETYLVYDIIKTLSQNNFLDELITSSIISEDMIADTASDELFSIRRKIKSETSRIQDSLSKYVQGNTYAKYLQENIITMRNGRYVIPVKSEYRNEIKGLVHDTSSSGATLFIEPESVVAANNEIKILQSREQEEIEKILYKISAECARFADDICKNYDGLCELDILFAKAELSYSMNACEPIIAKNQHIELKRARHPLLDKEKAVPIDVSVGKNYNLLVITGPNTGGKTVTLKTIGLFALMTQCGLHIPCADNSMMPVFDSVLADIGDEQSIEQSLSTFSAHMVNIVEILNKVSKNSLVLFDELGAGTDPIEGAALAESILESVRKTGCLCASTTHYAELKAYAMSTQGVMNGSCEFDVKTLKPTYRLMIGLPGKSNAFAIAKRLGIPEDIVNNAKNSISGETRRFESLISTLEEQKSIYENEKQKAAELRKQLQEINSKTRLDREKFDKRIKEQEDKAQEKARIIVEQARASADYIFNELEKVKKEKDKKNFSENLVKAREKVRNKLSDADKNVSSMKKTADFENYVLPRELKAGDSVILKDLGTRGTVVMVKGNSVTVQSGIIKTKTDISNLYLSEEAAPEKTVKRAVPALHAAETIRPELDIRGMIGDDAVLAVDKFLDDAQLANLSLVTVIHGKGTGVLRTAVTAFLKKDKNFRRG